jgi:hypothetical protein
MALGDVAEEIASSPTSDILEKHYKKIIEL